VAGTPTSSAWDAAGLYQVGHFPGFRWGEWNGIYRDDLRRFVRGDPGLVGAVADRISGSAALYQRSGHTPVNSINFVTAHDGFTLNDLVSYDGKRNEANGEDNRDGVDGNLSWNCGAEGATDDPAVDTLRNRQIRNFATLLMLSQGIPMMLMGDEVRRSQGGNNNAWCQDNPVGWFDWSDVAREADMLRFWSRLIAFRRAHPALMRSRFFTGARNAGGLPDISWHGTDLDAPGWDDPTARALAFTLGAPAAEADLHVMTNMFWEPLDMAVPALPGRAWLRAIDTARPAPDDITPDGVACAPEAGRLRVEARSVVVLVSA